MGKLKWYAKFIWLYGSSLFLPTAVVTPRVEKAVKEYEDWKQAEAARKEAKVARH